jgi:hypothetical protein
MTKRASFQGDIFIGTFVKQNKRGDTHQKLAFIPISKAHANNILSDNVHKIYIYSDNWSVNLLGMALTALLLY